MREPRIALSPSEGARWSARDGVFSPRESAPAQPHGAVHRGIEVQRGAAGSRHFASILRMLRPCLVSRDSGGGADLVGPSADCELLESASRFAAAQIDVWRVQRARHLLLLQGLSRNDYYPKSKEEFRRTITLMKEAFRLEAKLGFPVPMHITIPHPAKALGSSRG